MKSAKIGMGCLIAAAVITTCTALAHLSCIYWGPECYAVQMAPPVVVESAKAGTWLAPIGTVFVSGIFLILAAYALSAAQLLRPLPFLSSAIYTISGLCIIRGLLPIQLWSRHPIRVTETELTVGIAWLFTGVLYLYGYRVVNRYLKNTVVKQASL